MKQYGPALLSRAGFTLVELLLVIAVIGIVVSVVALSTGGSSAWSTLRGDATGVYSVTRHARAMAVAQSRRVKVEFFEQGDPLLWSYRLWVEEDPMDSPDVWTSPAKGWSETFRCSEGVQVRVVDREEIGSLNAVIFSPDGTAGAKDVELSHPRLQTVLRVSVSAVTGMASLEEVEGEP